MEKVAALTGGIVFLSDKVDALEKNASDLRSRLETFEKRAMAEDILVKARFSGGAPMELVARTADDFLSKRARLESKGIADLQKLAALVDLYTEDGIGLSDESDSIAKGDLTNWLKSIS